MAAALGHWLGLLKDVQQTQQMHVPTLSRSRFGPGSVLGAERGFGAAVAVPRLSPGTAV